MLHDTDRILKLAREAGLELAPGSLRLNEMGLDFQVAFGRDGDAVEWVLRMPRRTDVACAAVKEAKILDYFR
ncbi:aminoglycoside phosphotransferase, partial [Streptococcus suis]